jgi:hypothetical protein
MATLPLLTPLPTRPASNPLRTSLTIGISRLSCSSKCRSLPRAKSRGALVVSLEVLYETTRDRFHHDPRFRYGTESAILSGRARSGSHSKYRRSMGGVQCSPNNTGSLPDKRSGTVIGLAVEDVEAAVEELREANIPIVMEPQHGEWCWTAVIADPDGNQVGLHRRNDGTHG